MIIYITKVERVKLISKQYCKKYLSVEKSTPIYVDMK